ncbi:hypothetical protein M885DRAFT_236750 [Pelagophyceae sp. CCMP2097]|nr:hypothetical protein M885DRAFT_236750 [Pelagophyceae sp. CCMP2097]
MHKATRHSPHALAAASYRRHVEELETQRFERHATRGAADRAARARAAGAQRRRGVAPAPPSAGRARSVPPLPAVAVTPRWGSAAAVEEECPVCLSPLRHAVETPCRHRFCAPCLKQATLKSPNCPLCRSCLGRFAGAVDVVASPTSVIHGRPPSTATDGRRPKAPSRQTRCERRCGSTNRP